MRYFQGKPISAGIAVANAYIFHGAELTVERTQSDDPDQEWERLESALDEARSQIEKVKELAESQAGKEEASIFEAHEMFLDDPALLEAVEKNLQEERINAEAAWSDAIEQFVDELSQMGEEYFQERASDVRDVGQRVLRILTSHDGQAFQKLVEPSIVVARDLTPSDTVQLDKNLVEGFCTAEGGPTSHTSILARTLGLPAVVGLGEEILEVSPGTALAMDGRTGEVVVAPDDAVINKYQDKKSREKEKAQARLERAHERAVTSDGTHIKVLANIGRIGDAGAVLEYGAEGIGLLRTEFLYMDRQDPPDERAQLAAYNDILSVVGNLPVTVRTLDIGGDKPVPYLDMPDEQNPYLGWRAIRISLDRPDLFKNQLRALLRASAEHQVRVMFPMITSLQEFRAAVELLEEAHREVTKKGSQAPGDVPVGMMVETPAAVLMIDQFVQELSFLSIGTNDLVQYTMAAERGNHKLSTLSDACHPAILRQIERVVDVAQEKKIKVSVCGEMAADPIAIPLLLGLEIEELSMAPTAIPRAKDVVRRWSLQDAQDVARKALHAESAEEVRQLVRGYQT